MTDRSTLLELAAKVEALDGKLDNSIDVLVDVALFKPDAAYATIRSNDAGTKVVCTDHDGRNETHWAFEWTGDPVMTIAALRALANQPEDKP